MSAFQRETVLSVKHWTDSLFSFTATRDPGFRFQNGQFAMIGLEVDGRPLVRAYSMASANHEEALEFFSIKVSDGPLTSRLQKIREGDIDSGRPQGDRHAHHRKPDTGKATAAAFDRHWARAVRKPDQGPGCLRRLRDDHSGPWLPSGFRTGLRRTPGREVCGRTNCSDRLLADKLHLLPDRDPRAVSQSRPDHRPDRIRPAVRRHRASRAGS